MLNHTLIYPSVAPRSYLVDLGVGGCSYTDLGPNLIVMLSLDLDSALRNVAPAELSDSGLTEDEAWTVAMNNLGREISAGHLGLGIASFPEGGKAAFFENHWLASAAIYHNGLYGWFARELEADKLYALVSERDSAVIFSADCSMRVRERVERYSSDALARARKPFGRNLFRLDSDGPVHVNEA